MEASLLAAATQASQAPHIYMAIQDDRGGPVSVVFAIDRTRDGTPSDEPALRLTPENGECNLQFLRYYRFPPDAARRPVFSQNEALLEGVALADLPNFLAVAATAEMLRRDVITDPEESRPQNVCSRKLWEQMAASDFMKDAWHREETATPAREEAARFRDEAP